MNVQSQYRFSLVLALLIGIGAVVGIFHYQNVSSRYIFPIDKGTLSIT
ncbi:hypothetical protein [Leptolyngbya sp. NIES-2104]|nr:hypothetical protein [Leptolyngbya sp. NIES-2104]GAP97052.1 hypothetical protein NIES2104_35990 [Leptolyngbya sp. NIES-2104]